ncbi:MAG: virulence protein, partial [Rhodoferax sp.]|nr:virulence protein [Rhodoferax sp.]
MAAQLADEWLPGGKLTAGEYLVHSAWRSEKTPSLSVRVSGNNAGHWGDFGGDHKGRDLVSLYAAIHGMDNGHAAVELARRYGLETVANVQSAAPGTAADAPPRPPPPPPPKAARVSESEGWQTVLPVPPPPYGMAATFKHPYRKPEDIQHTGEYRVGEDLYGYVVRFRKSDGGKETIPYTFCQSARDGAAKWCWRQWDEPRPLYLPGHALPGDRTVVLVEGEKKAGVLQALLDEGAPNVYCVASWPGGSKAWKKADWRWLNRCAVIAWPDCDGKRENLTKAERDATPDDAARLVLQQSKPLLPEHKQTGMAAMLGIGATLRDEQACTVQLLPIPKPGAVDDGWDCADAILVDGWDFAKVIAFFAQAYALPADVTVPPSPPAAPGGGGGDGGKKFDPPAEAGDRDDEFQAHLDFMCEVMKCKIHDIQVTRKLLITALRKAPDLMDCLGFNELTGAPSTRVPFPWRDKAGPLGDSDDLRCGDWLSSEYKLKAASRAALMEAMATVADERRYHPIRDWFKEIKHDGVPRIDKWLIHVLGMDPAALPPKRKRYMEMVGRFLLIGMVARVMTPGCKFDYSPVFEGLTGMGKSTLVKELVSAEFFSDTHFDIGNGKEGMEQLEGLWAYELSEMTAFRRADNEQVKQFFSSTVDRFRGAYGKFVQQHPRQCVIICTTNKKVYLYDLTGNRRFWPVWIDQPVKLEWIRKFRGQLFAEAYALFLKGERYAPTREEEDEYFVPEQNKRVVESGVQSRLYELLTREGAPVATEARVTADLNLHTTFITLDRLVAALGTDVAKSSVMLEGQIRSWLEAQGWTYGRESTGQRRRGYKQPPVWPPVIADEEGTPVPLQEIEHGAPPTQA